MACVAASRAARDSLDLHVEPGSALRKSGVAPGFRLRSRRFRRFVAWIERSEIRERRSGSIAAPGFRSAQPGLRKMKEAERRQTQVTNRRILRCGARSTERARLPAFHRGSRLRELFHPKGSASGQASWDAVCTGVTRLR